MILRGQKTDPVSPLDSARSLEARLAPLLAEKDVEAVAAPVEPGSTAGERGA